MAEPKDPTTQDPTTGAVEPAGAAQAPEPTNPQGNEPTGAQGATEPLEDKHGQVGIARGKYERDIAERDAKIKELEAQIAEAAKTEEGRQKLTAEVDALRATIKDQALSYKLELVGCKSVKAAKALLADYDDDVDKLKDACPFLFEDAKPKGKVGAPPAGAAEDKEAKLAKARADLGVVIKKK